MENGKRNADVVFYVINFPIYPGKDISPIESLTSSSFLTRKSSEWTFWVRFHFVNSKNCIKNGKFRWGLIIFQPGEVLTRDADEMNVSRGNKNSVKLHSCTIFLRDNCETWRVSGLWRTLTWENIQLCNYLSSWVILNVVKFRVVKT